MIAVTKTQRVVHWVTYFGGGDYVVSPACDAIADIGDIARDGHDVTCPDCLDILEDAS